MLPNLEILIFYLIQENKYQGKQKINEVKFHSNLYLDKKFIQLFNDSNKFTINKLISIYEYMEDELWDFITDRYINKEYKLVGFSDNAKEALNKFYDEEDNRELKNGALTSLLIKFVCRYLPYLSKGSETRGLFEMLREKNLNLSEKIQNELKDMNNTFGAKLSDTNDITLYFVQKRNLKRKSQQQNKKVEKENDNENIINTDENKNNVEEEKNEEEEDEEDKDSNREI